MSFAVCRVEARMSKKDDNVPAYAACPRPQANHVHNALTKQLSVFCSM